MNSSAKNPPPNIGILVTTGRHPREVFELAVSAARKGVRVCILLAGSQPAKVLGDSLPDLARTARIVILREDAPQPGRSSGKRAQRSPFDAFECMPLDRMASLMKEYDRWVVL